ncbi:bactofilin family protein [Endozoicomonas ascidiicola]|uniref:bactofilin family protein n=1 Tax=Endozoicomonas ascidiicola TaxID=1698521 RepID=UPI00082F4790|nr:polymer-forming cytoskeletal protein [Endozoicomonas ascidiicola]
MFSHNKDTDKNSSNGATTLISAETTINGDISFSGSVHIEGNVQGNITSDNGQLTIIKTANIEGDIHAQNMTIYGTVNGNVYAEEYLELISGAVINGKVFYNVIEVAKGAQVNGTIEYRSSSEINKNVKSADNIEHLDSNVKEVTFRAGH